MKKSKTSFGILVMCFFILNTLQLKAQTTEMTLNVVTPGTLSTLLGSYEDSVQNLTVSGPLNGKDIVTICDMRALTVLNMADADIVKGGGAYYETWETADSTISMGMFYECDWLTSITLPKSVTRIDGLAFALCSGLKSMTIPTKVNYLDYSAFLGCFNLSKILADSTNVNFTSFEGVLFNKDTTCLVAFPFAKSSQYTIPNGVSTIGNGAFFYCMNLTLLTMPESLQTIGYDAFSYCTSLAKFIVKKDNPNYCSVSGVLFNKDTTKLVLCPNGKSGQYSIPKSVKTIESGAFYNCDKLTQLAISDSITKIDGSTFIGCWSLSKYSVSNTNPTYCSRDGVLFNKDTTLLVAYPVKKSSQYTIPPSVTAIGDYAFALSGLSYITLPVGITSIGDYAFESSTSMTLVTLGENIKSIGMGAFFYCNKLAKVKCKMTTAPTISSNVFEYVNQNTCKLYVPNGCLSAYSSKNVWKNFTSIIEDAPADVQPIDINLKSVYSVNGNVVISINEAASVTIYSLSGQKVYDNANLGKYTEIPLNKGLYVVRMNGKSTKVMVR